MRLTTIRDKILNAVLVAERIVGKKESLPILSCILLDSGKDLSIKATNLEAGIEINIPSDIEEVGIVAVPAPVLTQTLRLMRGDKIIIKTEEKNLVIESSGSRTLIKAIQHDEFPLIKPSAAEASGVRVARESILRGIKAVIYAASPSMIRPELGSIYISINGPEIVFVATDSFRLAERVVKGSTSKKEGEILIPLKHASELSHVLERTSEEEVELLADDSQLTVTAGKVRFTSRVVAGTFPNYKEIIPKKFTAEATVLKNDFAEALQKARVFSGNEQSLGLHLYPKRKIFTATAQSPDIGEMSDSINAATSGEDIDINFHIGYLADCLSSIESDSLILGFSGAGKPLVIRGVSDPGFTYLVMPLNR
ncbi:MAG TPA: DNA polymerase III subunit beta [Candidatus Paceibacterota bacterium]